jgi:hypothetical protein
LDLRKWLKKSNPITTEVLAQIDLSPEQIARLLDEPESA